MVEIKGASDSFENLRLELRRGSLVLAVLAALRTERYGYTLRRTLGDRGLEVDENTLYPLLRRLESQGLLVSEWREENKRNKRFYRLSEAGGQVLGRLLGEWSAIHAAVNEILGNGTILDKSAGAEIEKEGEQYDEHTVA